MPGQTESDQKERNREEGGIHYVNSDPGTLLYQKELPLVTVKIGKAKRLAAN